MFRRQRPGGGGRHPPPLAPTVSNFKPRAQWTNSGSSIFLYVNLPGFYRDQIEIKMDERTRTVQIQGQRPLSTQTKARFNETYRVPDSCDITKLNTSFSHGLLTIEFPTIVESEKPEKEVKDQRKSTVQKPKQEEIRLPDVKESNLGRKKPLDEEKQVGTSQQEKAAPKLKEEEPKTYKSVVEGKKALPTGSRDYKSEEKVKEGETNPSLRRKEEKVVERKEPAQLGQQKIVQKLKEEEAKSTPTVGGSVKQKVLAKLEEKVLTERKKDVDLGQDKSGENVKDKDVARTQINGGSLKQKVHDKLEEKVLTERKKDSDIGQDKIGEKVKNEDVARTHINGGNLDNKVYLNEVKVVERKGNAEEFQKLKEEGKIALGQKKQEKYTKPNVGDEARTTKKNLASKNREEAELKTKEIVQSSAPGVNGDLKSKQEEEKEKIGGDKVSEREIQEKIQEATIAKETGEVKESADDPMKEDPTQGGEETEKSLESEGNSLLVKEGQNKIEMDASEVKESKIYDRSLVNVGVAALVIMGFGAYVFVPVVKMFY